MNKKRQKLASEEITAGIRISISKIQEDLHIAYLLSGPVRRYPRSRAVWEGDAGVDNTKNTEVNASTLNWLIFYILDEKINTIWTSRL